MPAKTTPPPPSSIEFWKGGSVESANIGPARGDHKLGEITGPGLYFFLADNAAGKSQHLDLVARLQDERLLRQDANITRGELSAYMQIAATRVTFRRRTAGGQVEEPKLKNLDQLPRIESMPAPIGDIITGGNLQGDEARARLRLRSLLSYAPIDADDALATELATSYAGSDLPLASYRDAWADLIAEAKRRSKRLADLPYASAEEVTAWLLAQPREGILEDQKMLLDRLNALGNNGEKAHAIQLERVASMRGALDGILVAAGADESAMGRAPDLEAANDALRVAEGKLRTLEAEAAAVEREQARRARLASTQGDRPDLDATASELATARTALARASQARGAKASLVEQAERAKAVVADRVAQAGEGFGPAVARWRDAVVEIGGAIGVNFDLGVVDPVLPPVVPSFEPIEAMTADLQARMERAAGEVKTQIETENELALANADLTTAEEALGEARRRRDTADRNHDEATDRARRWDETEAQLAEALDRPDGEAIEAARAAVEKARTDKALARSKDTYGQAAAQLEQAEALASWLEESADEYREAARATWDALGLIVTRSLGLPWLAVEGLDLILYYDLDTGLMATDDTDPARSEERKLDDTDANSTAELHEACLRLMLSRREKLGGILILPWQVMAAMDQARLERFSGDAGRANLVVLSERPRRKGDPEGLLLERVDHAEVA